MEQKDSSGPLLEHFEHSSLVFRIQKCLPRLHVGTIYLRQAFYARRDKQQGLARRLLVVSGLMFSVIATGACGYWIIEGWGFIDSLYMSVITVTTVGFEEVQPLSSAGRAFTAILILLGVGGITYSFGTITNYLIAGELRGYLGARRMKRLISSLKDHYIVCGFGRMGQEVCRELQREGRAFIVVDQNEESIEKAREKGYIALSGDPGLDETLRECGIESAVGLTAVSDDDAKNLMVVISARGLKRRLAIVARVSGEDAPEKFLRAGAGSVFLPYLTGGRRVAQMLVRPAVVGFIEDVLHDRSSTGMLIENFTVVEGSRLEGRTLVEARIREETGAYVVGLQRETGIVADLGPRTVLQAGDTVIAIGRRDQLDLLGQSLWKGESDNKC